MLGFTASTNAFIRHVYSFLGGMAAIAGLAGISPDVFQQIVTSMHQIGDGVSSILAGVGPLLTIASGAYAAWKSTHGNQIAAVKAIPGMTVSGSPTPAPNAVTAAVRSHWAPLAVGLLLLAPMIGGCTTTPGGAKVLDPNVLATVQAGAQIVCGIAPTAGAVANLYTNNADVKTTESAIAVACAAAVPNSVVPATVAPPLTPAATVTPPSTSSGG